MPLNSVKLALIILILFVSPTIADQIKLSDQERTAFEKINPLFGPLLPDAGLEAASNFQSSMMALDKTGSFDTKMGELLRLAAAIGMKCEYCITAHTTMAKIAGATDDEIRQVVLMVAEVQLNSTILYGNSYNLDKFKSAFE